MSQKYDAYLQKQLTMFYCARVRESKLIYYSISQSITHINHRTSYTQSITHRSKNISNIRNI